MGHSKALEDLWFTLFVEGINLDSNIESVVYP